MKKLSKPSKNLKQINRITNINAHSKSFDFLTDEPEIYSIKDIKTKMGSKDSHCYC